MRQYPVPIYVGFDPREAACYHTFCQSVLERSSIPVSFIPLHSLNLKGFDGQKDGTNAFIYSRFLVPYLQGFRGWAIYADGDMVCLDDIANLWEAREAFIFDKACAVVKHNYKTKFSRKYIGTPMESDNKDYPKKNHSSLILWNCEHYANRVLLPEYVAGSPGTHLHRFGWADEKQIGELPQEWNALSGEQDISGANLIHFSLGAPGFDHYKNCDGAPHWHRAYKNATHMENE